jgi:hypothetical protein
MSAAAGRPISTGDVIDLVSGDTATTGVKRARPGGTTGDLETAKGWDDSKWIFGLHDGATAAQRKWASNFMATEWSLHCRGCGARRQANSQTFMGHLTTPECAKTRADSKNWFNGLLLTAFRPAAVLRVGAALE